MTRLGFRLIMGGGAPFSGPFFSLAFTNAFLLFLFFLSPLSSGEAADFSRSSTYENNSTLTTRFFGGTGQSCVFFRAARSSFFFLLRYANHAGCSALLSFLLADTDGLEVFDPSSRRIGDGNVFFLGIKGALFLSNRSCCCERLLSPFHTPD